TITWTVPLPLTIALPVKTPVGLIDRTELLPRVWLGEKFTTEATGISQPGEKRTKPRLEGATTVTLVESARAVTGMPQTPNTEKSRRAPEESTGPPSGPLAFRVSMTRQGERVKKFRATFEIAQGLWLEQAAVPGTTP